MLPDLNRAPVMDVPLTGSPYMDETRAPVKHMMKQARTNAITANPQSDLTHHMLRERFSLGPREAPKKVQRSMGGPSSLQTTKGIGKVTRPKRILPKKFREDPFAEPPPITEDDIRDGMMSLLNRGIIPRDVDLTPAFERGAPPIAFKPADLHPKEEERRARLQPMPALPYRAQGPHPQHPHP